MALFSIVNGALASVIPASITNKDNIVDLATIEGITVFRNSFFTSRSSSLFRIVTINVVEGDTFLLNETPAGSTGEKIAIVSNDDSNVVGYRSGSYQIITVASLLASEIIDIGLLSFTDMQTVMNVATGLTSPQIKYIKPVPNDTITFSEIT